MAATHYDSKIKSTSYNIYSGLQKFLFIGSSQGTKEFRKIIRYNWLGLSIKYIFIFIIECNCP